MRQNRLTRHKWWGKAFPYLLLIPSLIPILVVLIYPILRTAWMSFFSIKFQNPDEATFVGVDNYASLATSRNFGLGLKNSAVFTIGSVVFSLLIGLALALLLNKPWKGRGFFRSMVIIPWATPSVAAVLVFSWIFDYQFGVLNSALRSLGLIDANIPWLTSPNMAMVSLLVVNVFKYFSIATIMLLAGLQTIDIALYEVAKVDGANTLQQFFHITLPGLKSSAGVLVLLLTIWSFREYTPIKLLTNGGPARATETLVMQTYQEAFKYYNLGSASALGMITFLLSLLFSLLYFWLLFRSGRKEG